MIFWNIKFLWVLIEFLKCIWKLNWVKIGWNWKRKENWKKTNKETNYRSFSVLVQAACRSLRVHCRSKLEANGVSSGILNALSFACVTKRRVVWFSLCALSSVCTRRPVVRSRDQTACRPCVATGWSFGGTETTPFWRNWAAAPPYFSFFFAWLPFFLPKPNSSLSLLLSLSSGHFPRLSLLLAGGNLSSFLLFYFAIFVAF